MTAPHLRRSEHRKELPSVTESCICGAQLVYEGVSPRWAADDFRRAHAVCREAAAKPGVRMAPQRSVGLPNLDDLT